MTMAEVAYRARKNGTGQLVLYFVPLTLLLYLVMPQNYLVDVGTAYMLKNRLHASAAQVADFRLITTIPVYLSFIFGLTRDLWNPFGMRDRGYIWLFALLTAAGFFALAILPLTMSSLYVGVFFVTVTFRFLASAYQGLMALLGQERQMSGRITVVWQITQYIASLAAGFIAGYVSENLSTAATFILLGVLSFLIIAFGFAKPSAIFAHTYDRPEAKGTDLWGDLKRLARHRAIYAPIIMNLMFNFAPGGNTPLQYYLSDTLHASDAVYGEYNGIFAISFVPTLFLYGYLCRKYPLKNIIWWSLIITVPQMIPLVLIHSGTQALIMAVPEGLMGGLAVGAMYDLTMRSCPPGLQGSLMMMVEGVWFLASRASDVLGSAIYQADPKNGFLWCVIATTIMYAAMVPVILLVPKHVMDTADGEPNPALEADVRAEVAEAGA
jgi:MFS family permease